ncbi:hypothetical protein [Paenibacillus thiaminolyticus]|uniref:Uncharacterized protein n=1 Tax=Paenibacillus thiaminolyticus TaxID=49283 RepID=A0A3A3GYQ1_PANTH|nr:hypothetical protein [Paenibacillus thiaminolyticus]RJG21347.1 hypothetical protein DQX05_21845 [Paenibacillus thiaminolyticus]
MLGNFRRMMDIAVTVTFFLSAIYFSLQVIGDASEAIKNVDRQNQNKDRNMSQTLKITQERVYTGAEIINSLRLLPSLKYDILVEGHQFTSADDPDDVTLSMIIPTKQYRLIEARDDAGHIKRLAYQ